MNITDSIKNITGLSVGSGASSNKTGNTNSTNNTNNAGKATGPTVATEATSVKISPLSSQLQSLLQAQISTSSAFDTWKVEAIKRAITGGQFQVDTEKVANGLITSVKNLLQSRNDQA